MATSSSISGEAPAVSKARDDWRAEAWAVFQKDLRSELRTRAALVTILLFAVVTLIVIAFTARPEGEGLTQQGLDPNYRQLIAQGRDQELLRGVPEGTKTRQELLSALMWVILFFSAMAGLPRTFVKEEEMRTAAALRLAARPGAVFAGKLLFNALLVLSVLVVVLPLYLILYVPVILNWPLFLGFLVTGSLAMAGSATILGAIVARAGGKTYLMLPLAFPILLPILILGVKGTTAAIGGTGSNLLPALVSYMVAMVTVSALLFDKVWTDA